MGYVLPLEDVLRNRRQREAYLLRSQNLSMQKIGQKLGIKRSAVSRLLSRARQCAADKGVYLSEPPKLVRPMSLSGIQNV